MNEGKVVSMPLVSVIIPCYNHGKYLETAVDSVRSQSYKNVEVIIVDDGSVDDTSTIARKMQEVQYVFQENKGLSAARNIGLKHSKGDYLVFLDADDWLLEDAIKINLFHLLENKEAAFVSGAHVKYLEDKGLTEEKKMLLEEDHYQRLLRGNFIAMHATVMYQKWVFNAYQFDETLNAFEDYDLYLKITRKFKAVHHQSLIAAYRIHHSNMSGNVGLMLRHALMVLERQYQILVTKKEVEAYHLGMKYWRDYYTGQLYRDLNVLPMGELKQRKEKLTLLFKFNKPLFIKLLLKKLIH